MEMTDELVRKIIEEVRRRLEPAEPAPAVPVSGRPWKGRRVMTEAEVRAACPAAGGPGQTLSLAPGDILTPLARDYIQSLKIELDYG